MDWFQRDKEGITTSTEDKIEAPDGLWSQCPECKTATHAHKLEETLHCCPQCNHHFRIGSEVYFKILYGPGNYKELFATLEPADPLEFNDSKKYSDRVKATKEKTGLRESIRVAQGKLGERELVTACMDFQYIGGSMGAVMGEKIARAIDQCIKRKAALLIISRTGGARMMEGAFSLMQMAKVSAKLTQLSAKGLPFISLLTDPTTGGVTASFAMLGDLNIAEPRALIGFAGPRVIRETIGKDLPPGFQTAEFVLEHGFLDFIVERAQLKEKLTSVLAMLG